MDAGYDPGAFLGLPAEACDARRARVAVLPVPYEATVSYGGGTAKGPAALIEASKQVELYDRDFDDEPALRYGIHTLPPVPLPSPGPGGTAPAAAVDALERIARHTEVAARDGRFPLILGGEHSITPGVLSGLARARGDGRPFTVVHLDAHADLRDEYEGDPHSHACAARRLLDATSCEAIWQFGIRSLCAEEAALIRGEPGRLHTWFVEGMRPDGAWKEALAAGLRGKRVFVSFDVDALDPAVVPGTGTPEPDGLGWREVLAVAEVVAKSAAEVAGMDVVEAAPVPGLSYSEFNVAKLVYAMLNRFLSSDLQQPAN